MTALRHYVRRRRADARRSLVKAAHGGGVTLVLGAGVSMSRGLPSWQALVRSLWTDCYTPQMPDWLASGFDAPHPLALQIALEEIESAIRAQLQGQGERRRDVDPEEVERRLAGAIGEKFYAKIPPRDEHDTLGVLVEVLRREQCRTARRILRVVTFNADDLLEREANRDTSVGRAPILWPVGRASFHPRWGEGAHGQPPISVYHLHGFLTRSPAFKRSAPDTLVFTDAQYWESVANPSSFANRVMSQAMQDSRCVFVGMSMTDINLMRWLGLRRAEFVSDRSAHYRASGHPPGRAESKAREALDRHYWICTERDDPTRLIASHLERRGVSTVVLDAWGEPFETLMHECFDADR